MGLSEKIDALLSQVEKPVRYMGGEYGSVMKDLRGVDVRYAFLFPDVYEVGMSHLGMKILYHAINRMDGAWCERVFSPWLPKSGSGAGYVVEFFYLIREYVFTCVGRLL